MPDTFIILPPYVDLLRRHGLSDFDAVMRRKADAPPASAHWNRETVELRLDDGGRGRRFFLKRLFRAQPEHVVAALVRGRRPVPQPPAEWHNIERLEAAGVRCAARVALGVRSRMGLPSAAFVLLEAVPAQRTLDEWLNCGSDELPPWMRRRLLIELGRLARRIDAAGLRWLDPLAKHVFAAPAAEGRRGARWEFRLIDVERMAAGDTCGTAALGRARRPTGSTAQPSLGDADREPIPGGMPGLWNAAAFADMLDPSATDNGVRRPGRFDFWIYHGAIFGSDAAGRAARAALPKERRCLLRAAAAARDDSAACQVNPSECRSSEAPSTVDRELLIDDNVLPLLEHAGLATLDALLAHRAGDSLTKPGLATWRSRDRIALSDDGGNSHVFYLKRYRHPPWSAQLSRILAGHARRGSAGIERWAIRRLRRIGIEAPRIAAFGERLRGDFEQCGALLLYEAPGASLERLVAEAARGAGPPLPSRVRHEVIRRLARLVRRMHAHGLFHRDLYLSHVFVDFTPAGPRCSLIDLARLRRARRRDFRWRIKDLAALEYSSPPGVVHRADRLRFLREYLGMPSRARRRGLDANVEHVPLSAPLRSCTGRRMTRLSCGFDAAYERWIAAVERRVARMARHDAKHGRRGHRVEP
ncbi:MAG: hypothetical protein HUU22_07015 [Phycisphaerae bacterium]|nr:hypothetical protein [Phycisphaerae bacterium]NUQ45766.1 hypothetical protein [Phycisphaerae bacterium]